MNIAAKRTRTVNLSRQLVTAGHLAGVAQFVMLTPYPGIGRGLVAGLGERRTVHVRSHGHSLIAGSCAHP